MALKQAAGIVELCI